MIAAGKLCRDCKRKDLCPSGDNTTEVDCPCCNAVGCKECDGNGWLELTSCARKQVPRDVWETLTYCEWAEKGHLPVAGGVLDQSRWFIDAWLFVANEKAKLELPKEL